MSSPGSIEVLNDTDGKWTRLYVGSEQVWGWEEDGRSAQEIWDSVDDKGCIYGKYIGGFAGHAPWWMHAIIPKTRLRLCA